MTSIGDKMVRYRVAPKPLPKVKPIHHEGVFGHFEDVTDKAIARLDVLADRGAKEKARFFRYLKERVDAGKFGEMQELQLAEGKVRMDSDIVKYIDPSIWFESKIDQALRLGLDKREPMDILDIGTGPAHFPVVAEFYGHHVVGTDLPYRTTGKLERGHIYDALADIYRVKRIPLKIEAFTPLPPMDRRYGLVTAFLAAFNVDAERKPWSIDAWTYFLSDVRDNVLTDGGEIYMSLDNNKLTEQSWAFLSSHAMFVNDKAKQVRIADLSAIGS